MRFQHYSPRVANITDKDTANCRSAVVVLYWEEIILFAEWVNGTRNGCKSTDLYLIAEEGRKDSSVRRELPSGWWYVTGGELAKECGYENSSSILDCSWSEPGGGRVLCKVNDFCSFFTSTDLFRICSTLLLLLWPLRLPTGVIEPKDRMGAYDNWKLFRELTTMVPLAMRRILLTHFYPPCKRCLTWDWEIRMNHVNKNRVFNNWYLNVISKKALI